MHIPVLLKEVLECLDLKEGNFVIDGTINGGGHAKAMLEAVGPTGKLLGVDWDEVLIAKSDLRAKKNVLLRAQNYADLPAILHQEHLPRADALLLDLGFSSEQLEGSGRGFSFKREYGAEPLLMTYSDESEPARDILNSSREEEILEILRVYGEERYARQIAKAIVHMRKKERIMTAGDLVRIVESVVPENYERGRIHPATRTFQALRIFVNQEFQNVSRVLRELPQILVSGGRVVVITFHSLEDKIVKNAFRESVKGGALALINKKPLVATREEVLQNPRSRSAKLRAVIMA